MLTADKEIKCICCNHDNFVVILSLSHHKRELFSYTARDNISFGKIIALEKQKLINNLVEHLR